ncbi:PilN domain-containing protein [Jatrophihabitans fulvus]
MSVVDDRPPSANAARRPAARPAPAPDPSAGPLRFVAVRANLLPREIVAGRRTDAMRRRVLSGLAALVAVLTLAYGFSWWQTHTADEHLAAAQRERSALSAQTQKYAPLVRAKATTTAIEQQLRRLMVGDLPWRGMLTTLRQQAPAGVALTQVAGTLTTPVTGSDPDSAGGTGQQVLNRSGCTVVGPMTITGTAPDKRAVAAYADRLAGVKGLAAPYPTNVATAEGRTAFTLRVLVTTDALGGRYATGTGAPTCTKGN